MGILAIFIVAKRLMHQDATWYGGRPHPHPGDFVLDGDPFPLPKRGGAPHFSAHICAQTAAWIKMPLGTEVGVGLYATLC